MESSLYGSDEGFYLRRMPREDFYTAPELHPAFARVLSREVFRRLDAVARTFPEGPLSVLEIGSGDGTLAEQISTCLQQQDERPEWIRRLRYILVERVEEVLKKSLERLSGTKIRILGYSDIRSVKPIRGVILSNELFDALPVHLLEKRDGAFHEVYVDADGGAELGPLSRPELAEAARGVEPGLPEGGRHAVSLDALQCLRDLGGVLEAGWIFTVDYGRRMAAGAANPPRAFRRHTTDSDVLASPGRRDITASVDFSSLMREGERCGLGTESYGTLAAFLLERGILDFLPAGDDAAAFAERLKVKTLFHPDGMGEAFKVLVQRKGLPA